MLRDTATGCARFVLHTLNVDIMRLCILQFNQERNADRLEAAREAARSVLGSSPDVLLLQDVGDTQFLEFDRWRLARSDPIIDKRGRVYISSTVAVRPGTDIEVRLVPQTGIRIAAAVLTSRHGRDRTRTILVSAYVRPDEAQRRGTDLVEADLRQLFTSLQRKPSDRWVLGGDFNIRNHPWSGNAAYNAIGHHAAYIPNMCANIEGKCVTPVGMVTMMRANAQTTVDLTIAGQSTLVKSITTIRMTQERDHLPIAYTVEEERQPIQVATAADDSPIRRVGNLNKVNWQSFASHLKSALRTTDVQPTNTLEWRAIVACLYDSVHKSRPKPRLLGHNGNRQLHSWWDDDCEAASKTAQEARQAVEARVLEQHRHDPGHMGDRSIRRRILDAQRRDPDVRKTSHALSAAVHHAKSNTLLDRVGDLESKKGWEAIAVLRGKPSKAMAISPPLSNPNGRSAQTPEQKVDLLVQTIFPTVDREAEFQFIDRGVFAVGLPPVTSEEVLSAARDVVVDKACGPDGVPPQLLRQALLLCAPFVDRFLSVVNRFVERGEIPQDWSQANISVIPKPGAQRDLRLAKSYRPISLLNVASKLVDAVMTRRIHYLSNHRNGFLSLPNHFGSLPGISTSDAIGTILEKGQMRCAAGRRRPSHA